MKPKCQHCNDTGRIAVEPGSTLGYTCPDCGYEEEGEIDDDPQNEYDEEQEGQ